MLNAMGQKVKVLAKAHLPDRFLAKATLDLFCALIILDHSLFKPHPFTDLAHLYAQRIERLRK